MENNIKVNIELNVNGTPIEELISRLEEACRILSGNKTLSEWSELIVETDEEKPKVITTIKPMGSCEDPIEVADGYVVRMTPSH